MNNINLEISFPIGLCSGKYDTFIFLCFYLRIVWIRKCFVVRFRRLNCLLFKTTVSLNLLEACTHVISCTSECSSEHGGHLIHKWHYVLISLIFNISPCTVSANVQVHEQKGNEKLSPSLNKFSQLYSCKEIHCRKRKTRICLFSVILRFHKGSLKHTSTQPFDRPSASTVNLISCY